MVEQGRHPAILAEREAAQRLRDALDEAVAVRTALCKNSDPEGDAPDPATWDAYVMRWNKALATFDKESKND